jgi:serine/threonine protein phosphatase PrpC
VNLQDSELYVLVLATDGVTDMLSAEDVIRRVAISFWHSEENADRASSIITAQSTALPESDNSTCVSVFLKGAKA